MNDEKREYAWAARCTRCGAVFAITAETEDNDWKEDVAGWRAEGRTVVRVPIENAQIEYCSHIRPDAPPPVAWRVVESHRATTEKDGELTLRVANTLAAILTELKRIADSFDAMRRDPTLYSIFEKEERR